MNSTQSTLYFLTFRIWGFDTRRRHIRWWIRETKTKGFYAKSPWFRLYWTIFGSIWKRKLHCCLQKENCVKQAKTTQICTYPKPLLEQATRGTYTYHSPIRLHWQKQMGSLQLYLYCSRLQKTRGNSKFVGLVARVLVAYKYVLKIWINGSVNCILCNDSL